VEERPEAAASVFRSVLCLAGFWRPGWLSLNTIPRRLLAPAIESFPAIVKIDGTHMRGAIIGSAIPSEENPFVAHDMKFTSQTRHGSFWVRAKIRSARHVKSALNFFLELSYFTSAMPSYER
jgi:hypothetical protein